MSPEALSAPLTASASPGRSDVAARKRGLRKQREKGISIYIPAELLIAAGIDPNDPAPYYRIWAAQGRPRFVVNLYREP